MDTDLLLVVGIVLTVLALPSLLTAFTESRPPRTGALLILIGGALIVLALSQSAKGYTFGGLPEVILRVVGRFVN